MMGQDCFGALLLWGCALGACARAVPGRRGPRRRCLFRLLSARQHPAAGRRARLVGEQSLSLTHLD